MRTAPQGAGMSAAGLSAGSSAGLSAGFLGRALSLEMSAVQQFLVIARQFAAWGLDQQAAVFRAEAAAELEHAERLVARMLSLGLAPAVSVLRPMRTAPDPAGLLAIAAELEDDLARFYDHAAAACARQGDAVGATFFDHLKAEELAHAGRFRALSGGDAP